MSPAWPPGAPAPAAAGAGTTITGLTLASAGGGGGRHDDHRADVAELGGDRFGEPRSVALLAPAAFLARAEDDRLVGLVRAGDVDLVHPRVGAEVGALLGAAIDQAEEPAFHEGA